MDKCDFCNKVLYSSAGRRSLATGKTICDHCTYLNLHIKGKSGVKRRLVWPGAWQYYFESRIK